MRAVDTKAGIRTRCVHTGLGIDPATGSVVQPIYPSTVFVHGEYPAASSKYTRHGNPNRESLEQAIADLEGGAAALTFASGAAAITTLLSAEPFGSRDVFPDDFYYGTTLILENLFGDRLIWRRIDMANLDHARSAISASTRYVWIETPSNPLLKVTDIAAIIEIAHDAGARVIVDNTLATPVLQRPFEFGADVIVHSGTKYFGGHSDALLGALVFREEDELFEACRDYQRLGGAVPSPDTCWMVRRGLMTLPLRMREHCTNALRVAEWLKTRSDVADVFHPGLTSHPGHAIAARQMNGMFGGMISFTLKAGPKAAQRVPQLAQIISNATSLGGVESLWEHRASTEGEDSPTRPDLVRLSVGIEDADDLIADIEQALDRVAKG